MVKLKSTITKTVELFINILRRDSLELQITRSPDLLLNTLVKDELELQIEVR